MILFIPLYCRRLVAAGAGAPCFSIADYPVGGSGAIVDALVRGLEKNGGTLRLGTHVEQVYV